MKQKKINCLIILLNVLYLLLKKRWRHVRKRHSNELENIPRISASYIFVGLSEGDSMINRVEQRSINCPWISYALISVFFLFTHIRNTATVWFSLCFCFDFFRRSSVLRQTTTVSLGVYNFYIFVSAVKIDIL